LNTADLAGNGERDRYDESGSIDDRERYGDERMGEGSSTDNNRYGDETSDSASYLQEDGAARGHGEREERQPLFASNEAEGFRSRWTEIQTGFVDEPRSAVEYADGLVAEVMQELARSFARERQNLESQWDHGDSVSTEDLRLALQRYRSFFDRLLSM